MSKSKHRQRAYGWNPPKLSRDVPLPFSSGQDVASATQCTGLTPQMPESEAECESAAALFSTLPQKPQGNIGKGNPNNDESEINFHRGD